MSFSGRCGSEDNLVYSTKPLLTAADQIQNLRSYAVNMVLQWCLYHSPRLLAPPSYSHIQSPAKAFCTPPIPRCLHHSRRRYRCRGAFFSSARTWRFTTRFGESYARCCTSVVVRGFGYFVSASLMFTYWYDMIFEVHVHGRRIFMTCHLHSRCP